MTMPSAKYAPVAVPVTSSGGGASSSSSAFNRELEERFVAAVPVDAPSPEASPYLEVVSPATLPEGYTFEAEANGHAFTVRVPAGGVEEGQKFSVPFPAGADGYSGAAIPRASVPVGHWKDGLFDCCAHGCIHPALWNAWCCPLVLVAQVMSRLKLTWLAAEGGPAGTAAATFRILLGITIAFHVSYRLLGYVSLAFVDEYGEPSDAWYALQFACYALASSFGLFTMFLACRTRRLMRERYGIPEGQCKGCEDCCCAYWCTCCTVAQMARHTADYETYAGVCCSETGMPAHAPSIV